MILSDFKGGRGEYYLLADQQEFTYNSYMQTQV